MNYILFPAFVTLYKNESNKLCIYYFRGLDNQYNWIYQQFNEEQMPNHIKSMTPDGSIIYEFKSNVISINCHLISNNKHIKSKNVNIMYKN